MSLKVEGHEILSHEWWPTGRKDCGDRDIHALSDGQRIAQDWETAITAYEIWRTGLWETSADQ